MTQHRMCTMAGIVAGLALLATAAGAQQSAAPPDPARWAKDMQAFAEQDRIRKPPTSAVVFYGSSTMRRWNLAESFPGMETVNRGFGGAHMADLPHFVRQLVVPLRPRVVVMYAGGNDIERGAMPEDLVANFARTVRYIQVAWPETKIVVFGVKATPALAKEMAKIRETNQQLRAYAERERPRLPNTRESGPIVFLDVEKAILDAKGQPRKDLFLEDGVHLTPAGYTLYADMLRPHLN
jgi:lysophospholipase L1-like esterase